MFDLKKYIYTSGVSIKEKVKKNRTTQTMSSNMLLRLTTL